MSFQQLKSAMYWPNSDEIYSPSGAGPRMLVNLAQEKIGKTLERRLDRSGNVKVGLLTKSPKADLTAAPIAVVCEFDRPISNQHLAEAHRLAWNFSRTPLLITVEPNLVRTWSCCEVPAANESQIANLDFQIREATLNFQDPKSLSQHAAHALNWVRLANGDFYRQFPDRFKRDGRADQTLLKELKDVRQKLASQELPKDTIHDLIARVIFAQFLFDRKDSEGRSAINPALLARLYEEGALKQLHVELPTILGDYKESYNFFRWLNDKFNGDLFPGKGASKTARESEWRTEQTIVGPQHLQTLADFVSGTVGTKTGQQWFWRQYSFDVIPLEFISSIYEEFVTDNSAHYTPGFLVDFMLDGVLPWDGDEWNLRILDPACGSGIFLVKAFQRLIQRWKNANNNQQPTPSVLRQMLERNLFGVDKDPHAVRVASFSLYLTMCDEIDPKNYLSVWKFPRMRGVRLIESDFFAEGVAGFDSVKDAKSYDLVIGNAPWGKDSVTTASMKWAKDVEHRWEIANKAIGTLFLAKASLLATPVGLVSLIQPASALLFNQSGPSKRFREQFFSSFKVIEIVNLSALRFELFENATSPPCIVTFSPQEPDEDPLIYMCPKHFTEASDGGLNESSFSIVIDPQDISEITHMESLTDSTVWSAFAWGGRRDYWFIRRLKGLPNLRQKVEYGEVICRNGIERGSREIGYDDILGLPLLEDIDFPSDTFLSLDSSRLPKNRDQFVHRRTDLHAFQPPQLIVKRSWTQTEQRFRSVFVDKGRDGVLCSQNFVSLSFTDETQNDLQKAALFLNSKLATYFLFLSSGRMSAYRPNLTVDEVLSTPIPYGQMPQIPEPSFEMVDKLTEQLFELKPSELVLIDDAIEMSLKSLHGASGLSVASDIVDIQLLDQYCQYFMRVVKSIAGDDTRISTTIFQDADGQRLPVRLVAFYFNLKREVEISVEKIDSDELCCLLNELNEKYIEVNGTERGGIFFQRVARVYMEQDIHGVSTPVVYIIKPDRVRYWTRSAGLRDADEVVADAQHWRLSNPPIFDQAEA